MTSSTGSPVCDNEVDPEEMFGRRVRVEKLALSVDREHAASNVAENVFRLMARLLERRDEEILPFTALAQADAERANGQRDDRDDGELQPDAGLDRAAAILTGTTTSLKYRMMPSAAMNTPPPVGTRSDAVAMTRMYSAENGELAPFVTWTTAVTRTRSKIAWRYRKVGPGWRRYISP